ncbi:MAG TPA: A/G-specific adenine glycosylase [Terriglobales bacterium]|nr:A/G-specific adenine glycosylase [Terriglobales bacterium]
MKLKSAGVRRHFRRALLSWYDKNKRDLPWRRTRDPYRIWVSEIMLQQTRVAAVIGYYQRFLQRFPSVQKLAAARFDSVLTLWSGLGYYRRARALHATAKVIVSEHGGEFPQLANELRALPGIGRYTAAAIASIAFDQPVAIVDGNVERVLSRLSGTKLAGEPSWAFAQALLSTSRAGDFNQGIMELGATVCLPRDPQCLICPVRKFCSARGELPSLKLRKRQKREIYYSLNLSDGAVLLRRRPAKSSLMPGLWELPEMREPRGHTISSFTVRHSITVTDYLVRVCQNSHSDVAGGRWILQSRLAKLPLTGLTRKILRAIGVIQ